METARLDGIEPPTLGFEVQGVQKSDPNDRVASELPELSPSDHDCIHSLVAEVMSGRRALADAEEIARRLVRL